MNGNVSSFFETIRNTVLTQVFLWGVHKPVNSGGNEAVDHENGGFGWDPSAGWDFEEREGVTIFRDDRVRFEKAFALDHDEDLPPFPVQFAA